MVYEVKHDFDPKFARSFLSRIQVGWVNGGADQIRAVCESVPPPAKQCTLRGPLVPRSQIRHCQHWAKEACEALSQQGILDPIVTTTDE